MPRLSKFSPASVIIACTATFVGCAYYNYFYNAKKSYEEAERQRLGRAAATQTTARRSTGGSAYDRCIESAGRMLQYYPNSRWEDDALLLLAKAYYRTEKYRNSISKVDELTSKYPGSPRVLEGALWKGMALLKIGQPDSARAILASLFLPSAPPGLRSQAHLALGDYYFDDKRWEPALDEFKEVLKFVSEKQASWSEAWMKIGACLDELNRHDEVIEHLDKLLAGKHPRRVKFDAAVRRAIVLRKMGKPTEALGEFESLLRDAAFVDEFPRLQVEAARCERAIDEIDAARKRLEQLLETEARGAVAAEAQYELGSLYWEARRDLRKSLAALASVKSADRNSPFVPQADSLLREIEHLHQFWQRIGFIDRQLALIDSALAGLRVVRPADTIYVDSIQVIKKESAPARRGRDPRSRVSDPMRKLVEAAKAAGDTIDVSTPAVADTTAPLDSTVLAARDSELRAENMNLCSELAGYHLFERSDPDSARFYYQAVIEAGAEGDLWGRSMASIAYLVRARGDTTAHDSLFRIIRERLPDTEFAARADWLLDKKRPPAQQDSAQSILKSAEDAWRMANDPSRAIELYLQAASIADSGSDYRARALMGAAFLARHEMGDDSTANQYYAMVSNEFPNTPFGRMAKIKNRAAPAKAPPLERTIPFEDEFYADPFERDFLFDEETFAEPEDVDLIYPAGEVDEPPALLTSSSMLQNYIRSHYPFDAFDEGIAGTVELEFVVDKLGKVSGVAVSFVDPEGMGFEDAAERVLQSLRYRAGRHKGRASAVRIKQRFTFNLVEE